MVPDWPEAGLVSICDFLLKTCNNPSAKQDSTATVLQQGFHMLEPDVDCFLCGHRCRFIQML